MRYYSFKVALNAANYNGPFVSNQTIQISNTSFFRLRWASVVATAVIASTAKGSLRNDCTSILNIYGAAISMPIVKVARLADVIGVSSLNGFIVSCNSFAPFVGGIQIPSTQQLIIETLNSLPASIFSGFTVADVTNVDISATVVLGWDDNINELD